MLCPREPRALGVIPGPFLLCGHSSGPRRGEELSRRTAVALPDSVTTRVVRGTYVDGAGTPQRGSITFRVDRPRMATVESWRVTAERKSTRLDSSRVTISYAVSSWHVK